MPLPKENKAEIVTTYQTHEGDTGSAEVQVAIYTARIFQITDHLRTHKKDFHSRRGLLILVGKRRRFLKYIYSRDVQRYRDLIGRLGIRDQIGAAAQRASS
jgi:small subunit ribosomal protein S15